MFKLRTFKIKIMGCIKTIIQLSLIVFIVFFFTLCTDDLDTETPVIGKPDYWVNYNLLATQVSDATSLKFGVFVRKMILI